MKKEIWDILERQFYNNKDIFGERVNEYEINSLEEELGVKLPIEYRKFIGEYGCGVVGSSDIYGIGENKYMGKGGNVLDASLRYRKELPEKYRAIVIIGVDGSGNIVGINYPKDEIILYDHEFNKEEKICENFAKYLELAVYKELNIYF